MIFPDNGVVDGRETVVWLGFNPVHVHPSGWARNLVQKVVSETVKPE
jgi:hypothetical protein